MPRQTDSNGCARTIQNKSGAGFDPAAVVHSQVSQSEPEPLLKMTVRVAWIRLLPLHFAPSSLRRSFGHNTLEHRVSGVLSADRACFFLSTATLPSSRISARKPKPTAETGLNRDCNAKEAAGETRSILGCVPRRLRLKNSGRKQTDAKKRKLPQHPRKKKKKIPSLT